MHWDCRARVLVRLQVGIPLTTAALSHRTGLLSVLTLLVSVEIARNLRLGGWPARHFGGALLLIGEAFRSDQTGMVRPGAVVQNLAPCALACAVGVDRCLAPSSAPANVRSPTRPASSIRAGLHTLPSRKSIVLTQATVGKRFRIDDVPMGLAVLRECFLR